MPTARDLLHLDEDLIQAESARFIEGNKIGLVAKRRRLPAVHDMLELAAEAIATTDGRPVPATLPMRLRCARQMAGQSADTLWQPLGLSKDSTATKSTIAHYELGNRRPEEGKLQRLGRVLRVSGLWLATGLYSEPASADIIMPDWLSPFRGLLWEVIELIKSTPDGPLWLHQNRIRELAESQASNVSWDQPSIEAALRVVKRKAGLARAHADEWTQIGFSVPMRRHR